MGKACFTSRFIQNSPIAPCCPYSFLIKTLLRIFFNGIFLSINTTLFSLAHNKLKSR